MEQWIPVVGYEDRYEVSDLGRVRSIDRVVHNALSWKLPNGQRRRLRGKVLAQHLDRRPRNGYLWVRLGPKDAIKQKYVHRLVAEAFHGPCPPGMECRHLNGNKQVNAAMNLFWGTHQQNCQDRSLHGTRQRGGSHTRAKLTESAVRLIKSSAESTPDLARCFDVSYMAVWSIRSGKNWAWLT